MSLAKPYPALLDGAELPQFLVQRIKRKGKEDRIKLIDPLASSYRTKEFIYRSIAAAKPLAIAERFKVRGRQIEEARQLLIDELIACPVQLCNWREVADLIDHRHGVLSD